MDIKFDYQFEQTEDFSNLESGLEKRGFLGINKIDSLGLCHKDEKHYILRTDGLVIYSNYADGHARLSYLAEVEKIDKEHGRKTSFYSKRWGMENFSFEELDEIISIVDL